MERKSSFSETPQIDYTRLQQAAIYLENYEDHLKAVSLSIYGKTLTEIKDELDIEIADVESLIRRGNQIIDHALLLVEWQFKSNTDIPAPDKSGDADHSWKDKAECKNADYNLFFHPDHERGNARLKRNKMAKKICQSCIVKAECLEDALTRDDANGIWGGMTEEEREILKKKRKGRSAR